MSYKSSLRLVLCGFPVLAEVSNFTLNLHRNDVKSDVCEYDSLMNKTNKQQHLLILYMCRQTSWFMFVLSVIQLNICVLTKCKHKVILVCFSVILKFQSFTSRPILYFYLQNDFEHKTFNYGVILLWGFFFPQWNIWAHPPHWGSESIHQFGGCLLFLHDNTCWTRQFRHVHSHSHVMEGFIPQIKLSHGRQSDTFNICPWLSDERTISFLTSLQTAFIFVFFCVRPRSRANIHCYSGVNTHSIKGFRMIPQRNTWLFLSLIFQLVVLLQSQQQQQQQQMFSGEV